MLVPFFRTPAVQVMGVQLLAHLHAKSPYLLLF